MKPLSIRRVRMAQRLAGTLKRGLRMRTVLRMLSTDICCWLDCFVVLFRFVLEKNFCDVKGTCGNLLIALT